MIFRQNDAFRLSTSFILFSVTQNARLLSWSSDFGIPQAPLQKSVRMLTTNDTKVCLKIVSISNLLVETWIFLIHYSLFFVRVFITKFFEVQKEQQIAIKAHYALLIKLLFNDIVENRSVSEVIWGGQLSYSSSFPCLPP